MTKERIEKEIWDKNYYIKIQIIDAILFIEFNAIATRSRVTFHKLRYVSNYVTNFLSQFHGSQTISIFHRAETVPLSIRALKLQVRVVRKDTPYSRNRAV